MFGGAVWLWRVAEVRCWGPELALVPAEPVSAGCELVLKLGTAVCDALGVSHDVPIVGYAYGGDFRFAEHGHAGECFLQREAEG